jgi:YfiH family protein
LVTNKPGAAIGVLTADCLPIVLHDEKKHACGVVHAGWRGSVAGIAVRALGAMTKHFGTDPRDIKIYFGPAARGCCYEVRKDFHKGVSDEYAERVIVKKDSRFFFDNLRLNALQLMQVGALEKNFNFQYGLCTICDGSYHSYRRDGKQSQRQATVVVLE